MSGSVGTLPTNWVSGDLPLRHEGLGGGLQVPLEQVVVDIHIEPAPREISQTIAANKKK
jgi:hypothetical protein